MQPFFPPPEPREQVFICLCSAPVLLAFLDVSYRESDSSEGGSVGCILCFQSGEMTHSSGNLRLGSVLDTIGGASVCLKKTGWFSRGH